MYACLLSHLSLCLTLPNPMHLSPPAFSIHRVIQVRILEWVSMPSSRGLNPCLLQCGWIFSTEPQGTPLMSLYPSAKSTISCKVVGKITKNEIFQYIHGTWKYFVCQLNRIFLIFIFHFLIETASYLKQIFFFTHVHTNSVCVTKIFFRGMMMNRHCVSR